MVTPFDVRAEGSCTLADRGDVVDVASCSPAGSERVPHANCCMTEIAATGIAEIFKRLRFVVSDF
jgi:hypothetical protein